MWDVATGKERWFVHIPQSEVFAVAFSADGQTLAAGSAGVWLWRRATGRSLGQFPARDMGVWSLAFSPDNRLLAVGGFDGTVRVWAKEAAK